MTDCGTIYTTFFNVVPLMLVPLDIASALLAGAFDLDLLDGSETAVTSSPDPTAASSVVVLDVFAWFLFLDNPNISLKSIMVIAI